MTDFAKDAFTVTNLSAPKVIEDKDGQVIGYRITERMSIEEAKRRWPDHPYWSE